MRIWTCLSFLFLQLPSFCQDTYHVPRFWSKVSTVEKQENSSSNGSLYRLDQTALEKALLKVPNKANEGLTTSKTVITFPLPNGVYQSFLIEAANNFHPNLAQLYPEIKAFRGKTLDNSGTTIRFDLSQKGFSGMMHSNQEGVLFIDNLITDQPNHYKVYAKKDLLPTAFECEVQALKNELNATPSFNRNSAGDCQLRTFRLALACTGEYTAYHGGTTADALTAMNSTLTILNGVYEREAAVTFELIPNTTDLIFLDANSDPYTNDDLGDMLGEHQTVCDTRIGATNYDIGHVFGTALGGVAFLGVVCEDAFKAGGATGFIRPEGPLFAIDLVAHEIGHQLGATHTFNGDEAACAGSNRSNETAVEPGSGSTIMAYAGICPPQNIQDNSDPYFHAISLEQMHTTFNRTDCANFPLNFSNTAPEVNTSDAAYIIPPSTPFVLTMAADTENNSPLTYTWEQMDNGIAAQPPLSTNRVGPLFRSLPPNSAPTRYFPNLRDLTQNISSIWEVLPSVGRIMNFRGTVRDNQLNGGCTNETNVQIEVINGTPFKVLSPNISAIWEAGTEKRITWEAGSTNQNPINTTGVDILLSLDGGLTYPIEAANNLPNIGEGIILVPNIASTSVRFMVKANDNIFFDISDQNLEITKPANDFELTVLSNQSVCVPEVAVYDIILSETGTFSETIQLTTNNLPDGVIATFSNDQPRVPSTVQLLVESANLPAGNYTFTLIATGSTGEKSRTLNLEIAPTIPAAVSLHNPLNNSQNISTAPTFSWQADKIAASYQIEIGEEITFANPIFIQSNIVDTFYTLTQKLVNDTQYFWRVSGENACGEGIPSPINSFQTVNETCATFKPTDLPLEISPFFTATVRSEITIPDAGELLSIQVSNVQIEHSFISDLVVELESPTGTRIKLIDKICGEEMDLNLSFANEAGTIYSDISCPPTSSATVQPLASLNALMGTEVQGTWALIVQDVELLDGGMLNQWGLDICYKLAKPFRFTTEKTSVNCAGGNDGTATILPTGGSGSYQYLWSNGATSTSLENLQAGIYGVTISDGEQTEDTTIMIEEPLPLSIDFIKEKSGCIGENNGALITNVFGGTGAYQYQWSNGAISSNLSQLRTGVYSLTISDELGCILVDSVNIDAFPVIELAIETLVNPRCPTDTTGSASIISNDLSGTINYEWSNDLIGAIQDSLPIGTYLIEATDLNGCQGELMLSINREFDEVPPVLVLNSTTIYLDENGVGELPISAIDTGSFDDCGGLTLSVTQEVFDCQNIGIRNIGVSGKDDAGNETIKEINVIIVDTFAPVFEYLDFIQIAGCQTITTNVYPKAIDNCGTVNVQLLMAGEDGFEPDTTMLSFRAVDGNGNEAFCYIPIFREIALTVLSDVLSPTCTDENDGEATLLLFGGQAPYSYLWNDPDNQRTFTATNLASGDYEVTITDNTGCIFIESISIENPTPITITDSIITADINGTANGSIQITASGGTGMLQPIWFKDDLLVGADFTLDSLSAGVYQLNLTDENGCRTSQIFQVDMLTSTPIFSMVESLTLYPNPTKEIFTVDLSLSTLQNFSLTLINLLGEVVIPSAGFKGKGGQYIFDLGNFDNGVYLFRIEGTSGVLTKPVVLMK